MLAKHGGVSDALQVAVSRIPLLLTDNLVLDTIEHLRTRDFRARDKGRAGVTAWQRAHGPECEKILLTVRLFLSGRRLP